MQVCCNLIVSLIPTSGSAEILDPQLLDIANTLATSGGPTIDDLNSAANDAAVGVATPSYTIDEHHNRSSVHDRLVHVKQSSHGKLRFALDTLATKVLLCENGSEPPIAYGVEIAPGAALAVASNFKGKRHLKTKTITVRHEVIISAGVFQSPQLVGIIFELAVFLSVLNSCFLLAHGIPILRGIVNLEILITIILSCLASVTEENFPGTASSRSFIYRVWGPTSKVRDTHQLFSTLHLIKKFQIMTRSRIFGR